jgi:peptidoglycan/LPS O-acetylase OafA/YrhL
VSGAARSAPDRRSYRPALDGLRAVAVLAVMVYHSTTGWGRGGFLGVDVFFVLSGYLITGLLLDRPDEGRLSGLLAFYAGRARRLLPALLLLLVVVCVVGPRVLSGAAQSSVRGDALAALFYVANWRFILTESSYFDQFGDPSPVKHLWTLSIEEQYYLVFPVLLMGLLAVARRRRRVLLAGLVVLAGASAAWAAVLHDPAMDPSRIYYGTDTRAHELLIGAALAVAMPWVSRRLTPRSARFLGPVGLLAVAGVVAAFVLARETAAFNVLGGTVLFCLLVVAILVSVDVAPDGVAARLLRTAPLPWIGRLSYSLYLWHWPVYVLLSPERTGGSRVALFVVQLVVTTVVACGSYYLVELPVRHRRWSWTRRRSAVTVSALAVALVAAVALVSTARVAAAPSEDQVGDTSSSTVGGTDASRRIVLVGDSVATKLAEFFPPASYPGVSVSGVATLGCGTAPQDLVVNGTQQPRVTKCDGQLEAWRRAVSDADPQVIIWSLGAWEVYDHHDGDTVLRVGSRAYADYLTARMEEALAGFGDTARVVIPNVPCYGQRRFVYAGQDIAADRNDPERGEAVNDIIEDFARAHRDRVSVVDARSWLCPDGDFVEEKDGVVLRDDGVHYSPAGAPRFWAWLMPQIEPYLRG